MVEQTTTVGMRRKNGETGTRAIKPRNYPIQAKPGSLVIWNASIHSRGLLVWVNEPSDEGTKDSNTHAAK